MKKKKLLESPVVVVLLCVVAGAAVYFNAVAPMLKKDRPDVEASDNAAAEIPDQVPGAPEPPTGTAVDPAALRSDTMMVSDLHRVGWKRSGTRNPFVFVDSTRAKTPEFTNNDPTVVPVTAQQTSSNVRASRPNGNAAGSRTAVRSPLFAISRGSSGLVALVGTQIVRVGDTCEAGVVRAIDRSSVTMQTPRGTRILRLTTSNQGAAP